MLLLLFFVQCMFKYLLLTLGIQSLQPSQFLSSLFPSSLFQLIFFSLNLSSIPNQTPLLVLWHATDVHLSYESHMIDFPALVVISLVERPIKVVRFSFFTTILRGEIHFHWKSSEEVDGYLRSFRAGELALGSQSITFHQDCHRTDRIIIMLWVWVNQT